MNGITDIDQAAPPLPVRQQAGIVQAPTGRQPLPVSGVAADRLSGHGEPGWVLAPCPAHPCLRDGAEHLIDSKKGIKR